MKLGQKLMTSSMFFTIWLTSTISFSSLANANDGIIEDHNFWPSDSVPASLIPGVNGLEFCENAKEKLVNEDMMKVEKELTYLLDIDYLSTGKFQVHDQTLKSKKFHAHYPHLTSLFSEPFFHDDSGSLGLVKFAFLMDSKNSHFFTKEFMQSKEFIEAVYHAMTFKTTCADGTCKVEKLIKTPWPLPNVTLKMDKVSVETFDLSKAPHAIPSQFIDLFQGHEFDVISKQVGHPTKIVAMKIEDVDKNLVGGKIINLFYETLDPHQKPKTLVISLQVMALDAGAVVQKILTTFSHLVSKNVHREAGKFVDHIRLLQTK